jgi:hypothetical protein
METGPFCTETAHFCTETGLFRTETGRFRAEMGGGCAENYGCLAIWSGYRRSTSAFRGGFDKRSARNA